MTESSQYRRRRTTYVVGAAVITLSVSVCALWLPTCHHCRIDSVISVLCMASPSAVALATDFNIHVDDSTDIDAGKLHDVIASHSLHQHVTSPTHTQGHTLDLVITHDNQTINVHPVDPPLLSDHSFVVAGYDCLRPRPWRLQASVKYASGGRWTSMLSLLSFSAQSYTLPRHRTLRLQSTLTTRRCERCSTNMLHAEIKRVRTRVSTARWYDRECRDTKRTTRKL